MNIKALPPIDIKPLTTEKVANGIWVVKPVAVEISDEQAAQDYYRTSGLFSKPMTKRQKPSTGK